MQDLARLHRCEQTTNNNSECGGSVTRRSLSQHLTLPSVRRPALFSRRCDIPPSRSDNGLCVVTTLQTIPSTGIPFTIDVPYEFTLPNVTKIGAMARDDRLDLYGVVERLFERLVQLLDSTDGRPGCLSLSPLIGKFKERC